MALWWCQAHVSGWLALAVQLHDHSGSSKQTRDCIVRIESAIIQAMVHFTSKACILAQVRQANKWAM